MFQQLPWRVRTALGLSAAQFAGKIFKRFAQINVRLSLGQQVGKVLAEWVTGLHVIQLDDCGAGTEANILIRSRPSANQNSASNWRRIVFLLFVTCITLSCTAQDKPGQNIPTLRTQSNVVLTPTLVKDKSGKPIFGLHASDFIIEDDGIEQQVSMDEAEPEEAVSLVVAIQIGRSAPSEFQRMEGLSSLLDQIVDSPQVETAIVTFDSQVNLVQDFTFDSNQSEAQLRKTIAGRLRDMELSGDTSSAVIYDAVRYSVKLLEKQPEDSRRVLLLISETRDHGSHVVKLDDAITAVNESNTIVYSLAFSPAASSALDTLRGKEPAQPGGIGQLLVLARQAMRKNAAKSVASMTGGEYELFTSQKSFERLMTEFANHLHSRYLLRFEPKNPHSGLHEVRVRLRHPGNNVVLARRNYWVEQPEAAAH
jgi:VWFA-related protein